MSILGKLTGAVGDAVSAVKDAADDGAAHFVENLVEKAATPLLGERAAEALGDVVSFGTNCAIGNYAGAASDALDAVELDDDVPWLTQYLDAASEQFLSQYTAGVSAEAKIGSLVVGAGGEAGGGNDPMAWLSFARRIDG